MTFKYKRTRALNGATNPRRKGPEMPSQNEYKGTSEAGWRGARSSLMKFPIPFVVSTQDSISNKIEEGTTLRR